MPCKGCHNSAIYQSIYLFYIYLSIYLSIRFQLLYMCRISLQRVDRTKIVYVEKINQYVLTQLAYQVEVYKRGF